MTQQVFNASGTFTPPAGVTSVDVLVVGGGGGGAGESLATTAGGGGGAGRVRWATAIAVTPGVGETVTIGPGGAGGAVNTQGTDGTASSFGATSAAGGGGGGSGNTSSGSGLRNGRAGASGGGGGSNSSPAGTGGTASAGNVGGAGFATSTSSARAGGGGGGAGAAGTAGANAAIGGPGGAGSDQSANVGTGVGVAGWFGGGGGGGAASGAIGVAAGGQGGGGAGGEAAGAVTNPVAGTANTGGGGGGASGNVAGAAGGSGVVVVVYTVAAPGVPTAVSVTDVDDDALELSWSAPSTGGPVDHYEVRIDGGAESTQTSPYVFTGLDAGTEYDLEVRAVGTGGVSSWVLVTESTSFPTPPGYYRVELTLGSHSWDIEHGDAAAYGPLLPLSLGWDIPDAVEFFPAQANLTTLGFHVQTSDASDLVDVVKGTIVTMRMFVDADPDADPWQTFDGVVTQLDGETVPGVADPDTRDFRVTVYAADDNVRLADMYVGYTDDWPIEHIDERVERICTEAGITYDTQGLGTGLEGWLAARPAGAAISALDAVRTALKDAADEYDSEPPDVFYGRYVFKYVHAETTLTVYAFRRRVFDDSTITLDGGIVRAAGRWTKQPGPHAAEWVIVDGTVFGTPGAGIPFVRNTSLLDYTGDPPGSDTNYSAFTRDNLGESLLADASTALDGWSTRSLVYEAHLDPDPVTLWASDAPPLVVVPVVATPVGDELEVNGVDYVAGTLTGARLVIPPRGKFYIEFRLRSELLPGTDLPA